jgi:hypothetical protein
MYVTGVLSNDVEINYSFKKRKCFFNTTREGAFTLLEAQTREHSITDAKSQFSFECLENNTGHQ